MRRAAATTLVVVGLSALLGLFLRGDGPPPSDAGRPPGTADGAAAPGLARADAPALVPNPATDAPSDAVSDPPDPSEPVIVGRVVDERRWPVRRAGSFLLRLSPPADGRYEVNLHRWDPKPMEWVHVGRYRLETVEGGYRGEGLEPGRYRLVEPSARVATEAFDVADGEDAVVDWDLSRLAWVRGRVEAPAGADVRSAQVRSDLPSVRARDAPERRAVLFTKDGAFSLRVPGDRDVTLQPWHPDWVPAQAGGTATVRTATEGVVLRLEAGNEARLRFDPDPTGSDREGTYKVLLFAGEPGPKAAAERPLLVEGEDVRFTERGEEFRFTGFEPGTWTLWVDFPRHAPAVLRGTRLGKGRTDLGTVTLSEGSSVVLRLTRPEGSDARGWVHARHLGEPAYERRSFDTDAAEIRVPGLGPGTFRITAGTRVRGPSIDETVEVDGRNDVPLTLDLR